MSKGAGIKALRVEVLNKVMSKFPMPKGNFFTNLFGTTQLEGDTARWLMESGSVGMTPFVAPGSPAPVTTDDTWWGEGSARVAYYKEKRFFDEVWLNNMQQPEYNIGYINAAKQLAKTLSKLNYRCARRREWMLAQMMVNGQISYNSKAGLKFTVDFKVPSRHKIVLSGNNVWGTGSTRNPVRDMFDIKNMYLDDVMTDPEYIMMNNQTLRLLLFDTSIQDLLKKSSFGEGDLFARPAQVLGTLLGIGNLVIYNEMYEARTHITQNVSAAATTIYVDDVTDIEVGGKARLVDMSSSDDYKEEIVISGVDYVNNTITLASGTASAYKGGRDILYMRKKFIADNKILMFSTSFEGESIAEFAEAPFGMGRHWGQYTDNKDEWDPDGIWVRVQDKGMPVLYNPNTLFTLTVA